MAIENPQKTEIQTQNSSQAELVKHYTFNETGNIMICTIGGDSVGVDNTFRNICSEVGVFFSAMTKAISSIINPNTNKPYSLYNYNALKTLIDNSGMFIHLSEDQIKHESSQVGEAFSSELIQSLIGIDAGKAYLKFASAMVRSVGKEALALCNQEDKTESEVANIMFVCESLLGASLVNAIIIRLDVQIDTNLVGIKAKPCHHAPQPQKVVTSQWVFNKDVYMFVAPEFITKYASTLNVAKTPAYKEFVQILTDKLSTLHGVVR